LNPSGGSEILILAFSFLFLNMKQKLTLAVSLIFLLSSCLNFSNKEESVADTEFKTIKTGSEYSLDVPSHMRETDNLNDVASLQFQNIFKEMYVVVIDEDKQEFIDTFIELEEYDTTKSVAENYRTVQMKSFGESIEITSQSEPKAVRINGLDAQKVQFDGRIESVKAEIAYFITYIEGREKMYMIMAWTLKDRKQKYNKILDAISESFRQL
jgi:hypothetical protein